MAERADGLDELRARMETAAGGAAAARALARAAHGRLARVLDLIASGRGVREAGSGLNAASSELLVADALITEAAARAAANDGGLDEIPGELGLEDLSERARLIDEASA